MDFNKFKNIKPSANVKRAVTDSLTEKDTDLLALSSLPKKRHNRKLTVIVQTAAAVVIVLAITLWALIGRGIRNATPAVTPTDTTYYAMTHDEKVINGKAAIQSFFDDYMSGKACKLDIFSVHEYDENGIARGISTVYEMNEDGSGKLYYMASNDATYTAYEGAQYIDEKYFYNPQNAAYTNKLRFLIFDNDIDLLDFGQEHRDGIDLSFLETGEKSSDKLCFIDRQGAVTVTDGKVTDGIDTLYEFLRLYFNKYTTYLTIDGDTPMYIDAATQRSGISVYTDTDEAHGLVVYLNADYYKNTVTLQLKHERNSGELYKNIVTLKLDDLYKEGIFFETYKIQISQAPLYGAYTDMFVAMPTDTGLKHNKDLCEMLKANPPEYVDNVTYDITDLMYKALVFDSGLGIRLYTNANGELSDIVGMIFPHSPTMNVIPMRISDEILTAIKNGFGDETGEQK